MTLASDLVEETRAHLFSGDREETNLLTTTVDSDDTTVVTTYDFGGIQAGALIEIDLELMYVWSWTAASKSATVQRGMMGSTAAAHTSGALVRVRPKFPNFSIFRALKQDIADLSSPLNGLFRVVTLNVTYNAAVRGYNLTSATDVLDILELRYESLGSDVYWPEITSWNLSRSMDTSEFASGFALFLNEGADPGRTIRVRYKAPFGALTALSDNVETITGMSTSMADVPPLGAAARLTAAREVKRGFMEHQGEPRRAEEVPGGQQVRSATALLTLRRQRIQAEAARLYAQWPPKMQMVR